MYDEDESARPVGVVPVEGRGSLPFALLHGESLVAVASWALGEAGVELLDFTASWADVQARGTALVVHDPLCPGTPADFLREVVAAAADGRVVVGVRPVTDTVQGRRGRRRWGRPSTAPGCSRSPRPWCCPRPWWPRCRSCRRSTTWPTWWWRCASRTRCVLVEAPRDGPAGRPTSPTSGSWRGYPADPAPPSSRSARATSSGKVIFRLVAARAPPARTRSVYVATQPAVSVASNPSPRRARRPRAAGRPGTPAGSARRRAR